jgi:NADP-dependent 3-hydroxy acid dehydrogenase YdfG
MGAPLPAPRLVALELNVSGGWRRLLKFDLDACDADSVLDAADPAAAAAFAAEVCDRLGRCDAVVIAPGPAPRVQVDELSRDEWDAISAGGLTALVSAIAFSVIERGGGGVVVVVVDGAAHGDVAGTMVAEGLRAMAANMGIAWAGRDLRALVVSRDGAPERVVAALA